MPGVFRELEIAYKGETYTFTPSVKMLRRIEQTSDINILGVIHKVSQQADSGALPIFDLAAIACSVLREAGAKVVDEDEVYEEMMADMAANDARWIIGFCELLVTAISPPEREKKELAPAKTRPKSRPKPSR